MKIGLSYDLKEKIAPGQSAPEDAFEEYDSPETVAGLTAAIEAQGHSVVRLGGGREFLANILQNNIDFVAGNRFPLKNKTAMPFLNKVGNFIGGLS